MQLIQKIRAFISLRFLKFCTVGASGVVVNLTLLAVFSELFGIQVNVASALAIEASINSNFIINELWTFRDRSIDRSGMLRRGVMFHLVSLVGAAIQWLIFITANSLWLVLLCQSDDGSCGFAFDGTIFERYVIQPVVNPRDVGHLKYVSQLLGIGGATSWNYIVNFYWTWAIKTREAKHE